MIMEDRMELARRRRKQKAVDDKKDHEYWCKHARDFYRSIPRPKPVYIVAGKRKP